ncbi:hypothetical protein GOBAR_DD07048 [Gossypium barbadense]|nr:hypothetical protein GOBAR_DD07048 [Gossypium barbadense]
MEMEVVELKVRLHCKACEKAVRKSLLKINGVKCVEIDMTSSKITVLGYVDRKACPPLAAIVFKIRSPFCSKNYDASFPSPQAGRALSCSSPWPNIGSLCFLISIRSLLYCKIALYAIISLVETKGWLVHLQESEDVFSVDLDFWSVRSAV